MKGTGDEMAATGSVYKRCGCRDKTTGRRLEQHCPRLSERRHGSWTFACSAPNLVGTSDRKRQGGFPSKQVASRAMQEWLAQTERQRTAAGWTLDRWLRYWLTTQTKIRETTRFNYTRDVESFLIPYIGKICMADLDYHRLKDGFDRIAAGTGIAPSSLQHLRTTLRAALNHAVREGILASNPARKLRIPSGPKPVAQVWTPRRVQHWRQTGERPVVAVWTVSHLAAFLTTVLEDRFFALWWLIALRGLRRGEAAGLRWDDIDFKHRQLYIRRNRATAGHQVVEGPPKTAAGLRVIALDRHTIAILKAHLRRQLDQRAARIAAGNDRYESGYVFLRPDGRPVHPGYLTRRFGELVKRADVPPVRLHDLRHGAASLAHETGADLKTVQDLLGHSSIVTTADTYTSVLPQAHHKAAQAAAQAVLQADRKARQKIKNKARHNRPRPTPETGAPTPTRPTKPQKRRSKGSRTRGGHAQR